MYNVVPRNYWSSVKEENGRLKVTGSKPWAEARKFIDVTAGKKYRLRYNADLGNCAYLHIIVYNPADGSYVWVPSSGGITAGGNYSGTFTAAADRLEIRFQMPALPTGESTGYFYLDDIYLEEVVAYEGGGSVNGGRYRYQFNGKELDREVSSTTTYDYGFRIYSPGLGRFLSVDPLMKKYPFFTPYQFSSNMPVVAADLDGLESIIKVYANYSIQSKLSELNISIIETTKERQFKTAMANALLPTLDLPDQLKNGKYRYLVKETIINSLSINFVENFSTNPDGSKQTLITAVGDIDYEKLFGDREQEAVEKIGNVFDVADATSGNFMLGNLGPKFSVGSSAIKFGNYGLKVANGDYGALGQDVMEDLASGMVKYTAKAVATEIGLGSSAISLIGKFAPNMVGFLLTPLSANAPVSPATYRENEKRSTVRAHTISALLFKFMKNNTSSNVPSISSIPRAVNDHPEDRTKIPLNLNQEN